jgi:CRP-like cAMP-binding protein
MSFASPEYSFSHNRILHALSSHAVKTMVHQLEPVSVSSGQVLCQPGDTIRAVYFPLNAVISLVHHLDTGSTVEVALVGNEGLVGVELLLGEQLCSIAAVAQIAGEVLRMTNASFLRTCEETGALKTLVLSYIASLLLQISHTAVCNSMHSVEQRLCRWLLMCLDRCGRSDLPLTQQFISTMLGDRRETITVAEGKLQTAGLIRYSRGHLSVLDRAGIELRACQCYVEQRTYTGAR